MSSALPVLRFLNLFAAAIAAGGMTLVLVAIVPAKRGYPAAVQILVHQGIGPRIHRYLPFATLAAVAGALLQLAVGAPAGPLTVAGLTASAVSGLVSQFLMVPINGAIATWAPDAPPADHASKLARWNSFQRVRTAASVTALCSFLGATLWP